MPTNLLSADDATFDTSLGNWTGPATLTRVTSPTPHAGSGAIAVSNVHLSGAATSLAKVPLGTTPTIPAADIVTIYAWMQSTGPGILQVYGESSTMGSYFALAISGTVSTWTQKGHAIVNPADATFTVGFQHNGSVTSGTILYGSDVLLGHEPVNAPTLLTATPSGTDFVLAWTAPTIQYVGFINDPFSTPASVLAQCKVSIERADDGGAFTQVHVNTSGTSTGYTDTTTIAGHTYQYRIRYAVYTTTSKTTLAGYSAYSNTAGSAVGGWGVGQIRMGG